MNAQFLIAAAHSGAGKTTVTLGLLLTDMNGQPWPMIGLLDIATTMSPKKLTLGYRTAGEDPAALYHWLG